MTTIILLLFLILVASIVYRYTNNDVFDPSFLFLAGFIFAVIAALMNISFWGVDLHLKTVFVIILGVISFAFGSFIVRSFIKPKNWIIQNDCRINIRNWKVIFFTLFNVIITYLQYREVIRLYVYADSYFINLGIMTAYKNVIGMGYQINEFVEQLSKFSEMSTFVFVYVIVHNLIFTEKDKIRDNWMYGLPISVYLVLVIFRGGRGDFILLFAYIMFLVYFFSKLKNGWSRLVSRKFVRIAFIAFISFLLFFYVSKEWVGRVTNENLFVYMTKYIGGSIQLLDMYLVEPQTRSNVFLSETMPGLLNSLSKLGFGCWGNISVSLEFRTTETGILIGNVYTSLRRFYNDLGLFGVVYFPMILSVLFSGMYNYIKKNSNNIKKVKNIYVTIIYGSLIGIIPMQAMEDQFFISRISLGYVIELVILFICIKFLIENKKRNRIKIHIR